MLSSLKCGGFLPGHLHLALTYRSSTTFTEQLRCISNKSLYQKLNIPEKPTKPAVPFFRFTKQLTPTILKENPNMRRSEIVKIASKKWDIVDSKLKEKLKKEFTEELADYKKILAEYNKSLTPDQKDEIKRAIQHDLDVKEERKTKRKAQELGKPKRPLTVFGRFAQSRRDEETKYPSRIDFIKALGAEWKNASPEFKKKLSEDCRKDNEKWNEELKAWEEKMIKEGNLDVVRTTALKLSSLNDRACPGSDSTTSINELTDRGTRTSEIQRDQETVTYQAQHLKTVIRNKQDQGTVTNTNQEKPHVHQKPDILSSSNISATSQPQSSIDIQSENVNPPGKQTFSEPSRVVELKPVENSSEGLQRLPDNTEKSLKDFVDSVENSVTKSNEVPVDEDANKLKKAVVKIFSLFSKK